MHAGEILDWGAFFQHYRPSAVRFARGIVRDASLAEDVVQDAARALFESCEQDRLRVLSPEHARNYFYRTVHNLAVDAVRRASRAPEAAAPDPAQHAAKDAGPLDAILAQESSLAAARAERELFGAIETLPGSAREVLRLRYGEGLAFREIAERTGQPISTLHSRVEAALAKIRRRFGNPRGEA